MLFAIAFPLLVIFAFIFTFEDIASAAWNLSSALSRLTGVSMLNVICFAVSALYPVPVA